VQSFLLKVEKPARYVGGEYGAIEKDRKALNIAVAFPDLYEIGMSNQALKILYNNLNSIEDVRCERVFAPAPDFEAEIRSRGIPLYSLESFTPLGEFDIVACTLGYELGITGLLTMLDTAGIPLAAAERGEGSPIVLLGGPAASNPAPFAAFVDGVWIGEAEDEFWSLAGEIAVLKRSGAGRADVLAALRAHPAMWHPGKKARRNIHRKFSDVRSPANVFPVPSMKVVQDHGTVEIMRGCPNGCRFCHAGYWYRPMREKNAEAIFSEVDSFVSGGGYREVSLSSLSSGDFSEIGELITALNDRYREERISFQLPSLKVSTFALPLLEALSETRKSGLTFAIETPLDMWQLSINKQVCFENVVGILREAKLRGWKLAKFYFMIGLPVPASDEVEQEETAIVDFLLRIRSAVDLSLNVNIGTFVPKPHTPFQWSRQLSLEESDRKLSFIRGKLKGTGIKVSTHDPFTSYLEGIISRGADNVSDLIRSAFLRGCRLDAWEDHIRIDVWKEEIEKHPNVIPSFDNDLDAELPWDSVDSGVGKKVFAEEFLNSQKSMLTAACEDECDHLCGICSKKIHVTKNDASRFIDVRTAAGTKKPRSPDVNAYQGSDAETLRLVFAFSKLDSAVYLPHLGLLEVFNKALIRARIAIKYTEGFNPLPRLDFASPLSLGLRAENEIATLDLVEKIDAAAFIEALNPALPKGFRVKSAQTHHIPVGVKKVSAASVLWGFSYQSSGSDAELLVPASEEKSFRLSQSGESGLSSLVRNRVWARGENGEPLNYFSMYSNLYAIVG
jgi:radical SAM superfamily enzyme YgiQ (UPF0313 family)